MDANTSRRALETAIDAARQAEEWAQALEALVRHHGESELRDGAGQCRRYCSRALACLLQVDHGQVHEAPPFPELLHDPLPLQEADRSRQLMAALEAVLPLAEAVDARVKNPPAAHLAPNLRLIVAYLRLDLYRREREP